MLISFSFNSFTYSPCYILLCLCSWWPFHRMYMHTKHQQSQLKPLLIQLIETTCPSSLQLCISHVFLFPTDLRSSLLELIFFPVLSTPGRKCLQSTGLLSTTLKDLDLFKGECVCLVSLLAWHSSQMGTLTFRNSCWRLNVEPSSPRES